MDEKRIGWGTILVIILFIFYEIATIIFQFIFFLTSDLLELGFDLLFILLLVFFYDIDALILLIELIPFIDLIPLFVIYMLMKIATIDQPRKPLIAFDWSFKSKPKLHSIDETKDYSKSIDDEEKVFYGNDHEDVCVICMQKLEDGDEIIACPNGHLAHVVHILSLIHI